MNAGLPDLDITLTVTLTDRLTGEWDTYAGEEWGASRLRLLSHAFTVQQRLGGGGITVTGNAEAGRVHVWNSVGQTVFDNRWETEAETEALSG